MTNYDIYDVIQLKRAFKAAHAGMEAMFRENPGFDQAHIESAQAFISGCDLFAAFNNETPVHAANIQASLETYFETRPDQEMNALSVALIHRWVSAYAEEIEAIETPTKSREKTPHPALAELYSAKFRLTA